MMKDLQGIGTQPKAQRQPDAVQAVPNMYIDVVIGGQKQVYDIETATQLRAALIGALQPFDDAMKKAEAAQSQAANGSQPPNQSPSPDDLDQPAQQNAEPVAGEDAPPDA